jgi:hypothetical protein
MISIKALTIRSWRSVVRVALMMLACQGFSTGLHATTVTVIFNQLGPNLFRYTYTLTGTTLLANQEFDVQFDPTVYQSLANGKASSDFNLVLLQPNNPPGAPGDYSALAKVNNPSLAVPFSVDVATLGGTPPAASGQFFLIEQFNAQGQLVSQIGSGFTTSAVPEPTSAALIGAAVLLAGCWIARRRRYPDIRIRR